MKQRDIIARLQKIAARLAAAPADTEANAKRDLAATLAKHPAWTWMTHYAHQSGGLMQSCANAASNIEALIREIQIV